MEKYTGTPFLLIASIFIVIGLLLYFFHPKKPTFLFGYRTSNSLQTKQHWNYAQKYSAKVLIAGGLFQLLVYLIAYFLPDHSIMDYIGLISIFLTIAFVYVLTEKKLKSI